MSVENEHKMLLSVGEEEAEGASVDGALVSSVVGDGALVSSVHRDHTSGFCGGF
jgi:hypothetical protein